MRMLPILESGRIGHTKKWKILQLSLKMNGLVISSELNFMRIWAYVWAPSRIKFQFFFSQTNCITMQKWRDRRSHEQIHQRVLPSCLQDLQVELIHTKSACLPKFSQTHIPNLSKVHTRQHQTRWDWLKFLQQAQGFLDLVACHHQMLGFEGSLFIFLSTRFVDQF